VVGRGRIKFLATAAAALAIPASAVAAKPLGGATYRDCAAQNGMTVCKVNQISVTPNARKVSKFVAFTRCAPVPFKAPLAMKINAAGAFALTADRVDISGHTVHVVIKGRFTAVDRAKGTMRFTRHGCDAGAVRFDARAALG
jgi:hypothetical protein